MQTRELNTTLYGTQTERFAKGEINGINWRYSHCDTSGAGRFGGGWQWQLGFQCGNLSRKRGHIIINLLVATLTIKWGPR